MSDEQLTPERQGEAWHLNKRVTIALAGIVATLAVAFVGQALTLIKWGSSVQTSIESQHATNAIVSKRLDTLEANDKDSIRLGEKVVRVETLVENMQHTVNKIDIALDPLIRNGKRDRK